MAVLNSIAAGAEDMKAWRRHLHANPELGLDCHATADFVAARLAEFGVDEIHRGIGRTGVVALIRGRGDGPVIGLRADMDALPIVEATGAAHASTVPGRMHACGHDGHTTMLLGAARYLAETRNFAGTVALIFQPGEEGAGGARAMIADGLMTRFAPTRIFALHTTPELELGRFATRPGPIMAAVDDFDITVTGRGGHAAMPQTTADPIPAALAIGQALMTIPARNISALERTVLSLTRVEAGSAHNIVPQSARLAGTIRSHDEAARRRIHERMAEICSGTGTAMGVEVVLSIREEVAPTVNDPDQAAFAVAVARELAGGDKVEAEMPPRMGGEDFSDMLALCPGAFVRIGQGTGAALHNDRFDFNDAAAPWGASFLARLVETAQPL